MQPTSFKHINALLRDLLAEIRGVLGEQLIGLYLYGSLVTGDYLEGVSDVDLLAATAGNIDGAELAALIQMHARFVDDRPAWDDRIEVAYLSVAALQTFKSQTGQIAIISPGEPLHVGKAGLDWLMNWYLVRDHGLTLFGPPPETIVPPISRDEFVEAVRDHARASAIWAAQRPGRKAHSYAVLTLCRALYTHRFGEHVSKERAATWAQGAMAQWAPLIDDALQWRSVAHAPDDGASLPGAANFLQFVREQIHRTSRHRHKRRDTPVAGGRGHATDDAD